MEMDAPSLQVDDNGKTEAGADECVGPVVAVAPEDERKELSGSNGQVKDQMEEEEDLEYGLCRHAVPITSMIFSVLLLTSSVILLDDVLKSQRMNPKCEAVALNDVLLTSVLGIATATSQFFCSLLKMKEVAVVGVGGGGGGGNFRCAHIIFAVIMGFMATTAYTGGIYDYGTGLLFMHTSFLDFIACLACTL